MKAITIADLDVVLRYQNENVVDRFIVDHDASPRQAATLFEDAKRWLWLCAVAQRDKELGVQDVPDMIIFETQTDLDEMWHTFLLFTRDYVEFCHQYFGFYIHHAPTPEREKREYGELDAERQRAGRHKKAGLRRANAAYVFDKLGEDVARRWFLPSAALSQAGKGVDPETFHHAYRDNAPWEIGVPQPRVLEIIETGGLRGDVLDVGCGTGENALSIAGAGHRVHGVDLVPRAIELATRKAERWGVTGATFEVADVRSLALGRRWGTILDAGVIHAFSDEDRARYVSALADHLAPGGILHIVCFSDAQDGIGPRRISQAEIGDVFGGPAWSLRDIVPCTYEVQSGLKPAWHASFERTGYGAPQTARKPTVPSGSNVVAGSTACGLRS
jgi:2-polyprenyl-3-methyl-5-hydroxy-6-metoxy-1,4-benzoquinol methylase